MKKEYILLPFIGIIAAILAAEVCIRILEKGLVANRIRSDRPERYYYDEVGSNRNNRYTKEKPKDLYRIAVIGDSFTFGFGVAFDDTYSKRLERILNLNKDQPKVEVLNLGVPGLSTFQEKEEVEKALKILSPDLVLLQITLNDPEIKPYRAPHGALTDQSEKAQEVPFFKIFHSIGFLWSRIENTRSHRRYIEYFQNLWTNEDTLDHFKVGYREIVRDCRDANVPLATVIFPLVTFPLDANYPFFNAHKIARDTAAEFNIPSLDLYSAYEGMDVIRLQAQPGVDPHPSEIAHRIAAEKILLWLREANLIPDKIFPKRSAKKREEPRQFY